MTVREQLLELLSKESAGELQKVVVAFEVKGKAPHAVHNLATNAQAITFCSKALPLSYDDLVDILRGRQ